MNNPLPRWWVWMFIITIVFALLYLVAYPGLGNFKGKLAWSSGGEHEAEVEQGCQQGTGAPVCPLHRYAARQAGCRSAGHGHWRAPVHEQLRAVPRLGRSRQQGLPNLTDADWLHGGNPTRSRKPWSKGAMADASHGRCRGHTGRCQERGQLCAEPVGQPHDSLRASLGKGKFGACAACHGMDGKGNQALGAPT
jgi:cytochrome c oxidase cbb3-type subunit 3